jgi:methionyl-tRNA formyltransferase
VIVCIAGKNDIAVNALAYLLDNKENLKISEIYSLCIQGDTGVDGWQRSFKKFSQDNGVPIKSLEEIYKIEDLIFISLEFDKIVKINYFKSKKLFNIHFSLLPKYKGCFTSIFPIANGEKYSGVTLHCIDEGIDTGNIIDLKKFEIGLNDTARDLYMKYMYHSYQIFIKNIKLLINGSYIARPQGLLNSSYYSRKSIDFQKNYINTNKTSFEIHNSIRALIFAEYQLPIFNGVRIVRSIMTDDKIDRKSVVSKKSHFEISGIDCYKIILHKE